MFGVQRIGRYEVLNHLASGGMGQVYLARATGLGGFERQVVVKTLDLSVTEDDDAFVTMFLDEARLVGALHHQYIAPVYEVGCDEEGRYYLVMDYVHGETAEAVVRVCSERTVRVPLAFALTVVSCVASALDYAHALCSADGTPLDIVHRDVSLSNVMCGHDGAVKLIDFGIAKASNRATKTQVGTLKGKIGYLAPEQIHRRAVDHRADIFALGIVLYELTTGTRAFREASDLLTLERITKGEVRRPSEVIAGYPAELERIVMKALDVDPSRRFQDAAAMARELEGFARRQDIPLGHGAVAGVMAKLFSDHRGRRRIARGSNDVKTDPTIAALSSGQDEKTPITDIVETDTRTVTVDERFSVNLRAQRPTLPIKEGARSQRPTTPTPGRKPRAAMLPLEERPTPIGDPAAQLRARNALIPLEDRPTPIAHVPALDARRIPTGPQQPVDALGSDTDVDDAPTVIGAELSDRLDPTDTQPHVKPTVPTAFASPPPPPAIYLRERNLATAVVARMKQLRDAQPATVQSWVLVCGMFAIAVAVAVIVALL